MKISVKFDIGEEVFPVALQKSGWQPVPPGKVTNISISISATNGTAITYLVGGRYYTSDQVFLTALMAEKYAQKKQKEK
jgi:hypothetical protein